MLLVNARFSLEHWLTLVELFAFGRDQGLDGEYHHGLYVSCRAIASVGKLCTEVSLRESRIDGDLDDDEPPEEKDIVHAFVVSTNKKGCFVRLSRFVTGRVKLKELSDSFLPDPATMFPPGRLVVGKVKQVHVKKDKMSRKDQVTVDLDMRESILLEDQNKLTFGDVQEGEKYGGVVTRIESYGVFVRLDNSEVSGLAHLSECSDDYIKSLSALYDPGDLVKVLVLKVDKDEKCISFSLKASHFEDEESDSESEDEDEDVEMAEAEVKFVDDSDSDDNIVNQTETPEEDSDSDSDGSASSGSDTSGDESSSDDDDGP